MKFKLMIAVLLLLSACFFWFLKKEKADTSTTATAAGTFKGYDVFQDGVSFGPDIVLGQTTIAQMAEKFPGGSPFIKVKRTASDCYRVEQGNYCGIEGAHADIAYDKQYMRFTFSDNDRISKYWKKPKMILTFNSRAI